jgi:RND superfamily putative drug exporter
MGDGSFGFSAGELETIARLRVPLTMVVISNATYGWIKAGQKSGFQQRYFSVDFSRTDHAAVAAAFGVVVAIFQWGWGSELLGLGRAGPIEPFLPVIMVSVLFGLSMDYQVFLVSRMYEEWLETGDNRRAVRIGLAETSRVINSAAVIMISVFLAFVLSGDRVIAMFGIALAAAVALDAFVLRTLLVPALMHMLGGANWWLPRWLDKRMPRISIEPPESRAAHERLAAATDAEVADVLAEEERQRDVRDIAG